MNRRAEVRLVDVPGCLNVDPDNRIDVTADLDTPGACAAETAQPPSANGCEAKSTTAACQATVDAH